VSAGDTATGPLLFEANSREQVGWRRGRTRPHLRPFAQSAQGQFRMVNIKELRFLVYRDIILNRGAGVEIKRRSVCVDLM